MSSSKRGKDSKNSEKSVEKSAKHYQSLLHQPRFRFRWIPTSPEEFAASETKLLSYLSDPYEIRDVSAGSFVENGDEGWLAWIFGRTSATQTARHVKIRTLFVNKSSPEIPLVLINGLGMGCATWAALIKRISYPGPVIALDLPGFARSTKLKFPKNADDAEATFIKILEGWRSNLGLEKFVLAGLSFGGFIATSYALSYPDRVAHLVGIDPWGFVEKPLKVVSLLTIENPIVIRLLALVASVCNVLTIHLILGPWGPWAFSYFDPSIGAYKDSIEYEFHCTAVPNLTGLDAFHCMSNWIVYAKRPLDKRLHKLRVKTTMILAECSWVPRISEEEMRTCMGPSGRLDYMTIPSAFHENIATIKETEDIFHTLIREGWANK